MMVRYRELASLRVTHTYCGGISRDVGFVIPQDTAATLRSRRLTSGVSGGVLRFLYEADDAGQHIVSAAGATLRIGLKVEGAVFGNVTDPVSLPATGIAFWRNRANATELSAMEARTLVGPIFAHPLSTDTRPVTVAVEDDAGHTIFSEVVTAEPGRSAISIDLLLQGAAVGPFTVREEYPPAPARTTRYLFHPELARERPLGVVDLTISESVYANASPPAFEVGFAARSETLRYYLVAANYSDADVERLKVADAGAVEDGRVKIEFDKVPAEAFGPDELPAVVLGSDPGSKVVLFRSRTPVARQERARRKIQLARSGDVLIEHLPQPRPEQADANLIVHVSKAK